MVLREKKQRKPIIADMALGLLIFLSLLAAGYGHLRALRTDRSAVTGIELLYGPSVMLALGRGFIEPDLLEYPGLRVFLRGEIESLPPDAVPAQVLENPSPVASYHRYLVYTVAFFWRLFGISWTSLEPLLALLFAWSGVAIYGIMRLGMRKTFAVVVTLGFMISPAMLGTLTELRDFSKAPFILSVLAVLIFLIKYGVRFRQLLLCAASLGLIIGTGMGFRQDIFVFLPLSLVVLAVSAFRTNIPPRRWVRLAALPVCFACYYATAWPMMGHLEGGAHPGHHLIQGFSNKRMDNLGIHPASYRLVASGSDHYIFSTVYDHMQRLGKDKAGHFTMDTHGSDLAGQQWLQDIVWRFPADLAARGYAAVLRNLRYADAYPPTFLEPTLWHRKLYAIHRGIASHLHRFGIFYGLAGLCILAGTHPTLGLGVYLFVLYVLGYIALQCEYRHAFHLSFFPFWILGFLVERTVSAVGYIREHGLPGMKWMLQVSMRVGFVLTCCLLMLVTPLTALRVYQSARVRPLLDLAMQAPRTRVPVTENHLHGWTLFEVTNQEGPTQQRDIKALIKILASILSPELRLWHVRGRYFVAEFKAGADVDWLIQKYRSPIPFNDFSQLVRMPEVAHEDIIRYYFPVYELLMPSLERELLIGRNHFTGIALPDNQADAFLGLYEVEIPEGMNLLMQCAQTDEHPANALYQRIGFSPDPVLYYQSEKNATDNLNLAEAARRFRSREEALFFIRAQLVLCRQPETRLVLAGWLLEEEAPEEALEAVLSIRNESPDLIIPRANLLEMLGRTFQLMKNAGQAETAFVAAWTLAPEREIPLRLELAKALGEQGRTEEALTLYRFVLLKDPENEAAVMNADLLLLQASDTEQRESFWEEISENRAEALQPWLRLGAVREAAGDYTAAARAYEAAFQHHPEVPEAAVRYAAFGVDALNPEVSRDILNRALETRPELRTLAAECLVKAGSGQYETGHIEEALAAFNLAAEYSPENEWIQLKQAQAHAAAGDHDEARITFESLLNGQYGRDAALGLDALLRDSGRDRIAYWHALASRYPRNDHVRFFTEQAGGTAGRALFESGRYAEAARILEETCPEPCMSPEQAVLIDLARLAATGNGNPEPRIRQWIQSAPSQSSQVVSWMLSAVEHLTATGKLDQALAMANTAAVVAPGKEDSWLALAGVQQHLEDYEGMLATCLASLDALEPTERIAAVMDNAFILLNAGERRIQTWRGLVERRPDNPVVLLHLGLAFEADNNWRQAAETYGRMIKLDCSSNDVRLRLGSVLVRAGDIDEGVRTLQEATTGETTNDPETPSLLQLAGNALLEAKQPEQAERMYRLAAEKKPEDGFTRLQLGDALFQQKKIEDAMEAWKQTILLEPESPMAAQAARLINQRLTPEKRLPYWRTFDKQSSDIPLVRAYHALACACAGDTAQAKELLITIAVAQSVTGEHGMITGIIACLDGEVEPGVNQVRVAAAGRPELPGDAAGYLAEIGMALKEKRSFDTAEPMLRAAALLEPDNLLHAVHLGETLLELARVQEAIDTFVNILMTAPESPRTAVLLEEAFRRKQDREGRLRIWQSIVSAHPDAMIPRRYLTEAE